MRRSVVLTMSGVSLVVVGLSLRASSSLPPARVVAGRVPVGVVAAGPAPGPTAPAATARTTRRAPAPRATASTPTRRATHRAVARRTVAPAPVATRSPSPKPAALPTYTVTGSAVDTQYGPVQVQLKIRGRRIVAADAVEYPQGSGQDQQINSYAIPQLDDETLQAQSAQIDSVSGATYTSQGYISSLQSALDRARQAGVF